MQDALCFVVTCMHDCRLVALILNWVNVLELNVVISIQLCCVAYLFSTILLQFFYKFRYFKFFIVSTKCKYIHWQLYCLNSRPGRQGASGVILGYTAKTINNLFWKPTTQSTITWKKINVVRFNAQKWEVGRSGN